MICNTNLESKLPYGSSHTAAPQVIRIPLKQ